MNGKPDRLGLVRQGPLDGPLDPPGCVSAQLASLPGVEALDRLHEADIALRNQVQQRQPEIGVVARDLDDQPRFALTISIWAF
jgi:hypothetical protein